MKLMRNFLSMLVAVAISTSFVSCSDDDDDKIISAATAVAGTYEVYVSVDFTYISTPYYYANQTVTITAVSDETVNVAYSNDTWGDYEVSGAKVTANSDGSYTIEGEGTATISAHGGSATSYACALNATIGSSKDINELTFTMSFMGTTTVTLVSGDCPSAYLLAGEGSKSGYTEVVFAYASMFYTDQSLTITPSSETTITVEYSNDTWGDYVAEDVVVTANSDGTYTLEGSGTATISYHGSTASEYAFELTGTADSDGTVTEIAFYMEFMGGTTVSFIEADAPAAYVIDGDYAGNVDAVFAYGSYSYEDQTVTVSGSVGSETVSITYSNDTWGDYSFTDVEIAVDDDGNYTLSAAGTATIAYHGNEATDYDCTLTATISSDKSTYSFSFYMTFMGGTTLTLTNATEEE